MLSLHARSVAFHDSPKKNFLEAAFPRLPEIAIYQAGVPFVRSLMTIAVQLLGLLEQLPQVAYTS